MKSITAATMLALVSLSSSGFAAQDAAQVLRNPNPLSAIDPASLTGFRDRPLFSPTRTRPAEPEPTSEPATIIEPVETLDIQLLGVIGTPDGSSALIVDLNDDSRHALRIGETFHGWTVSDMNGTEMMVQRDSDTRRISIFKPAESGQEGAGTSDDGTP